MENKEIQGTGNGDRHDNWRLALTLIAVVLFQITSTSMIPRKVITSRQTNERIEDLEKSKEAADQVQKKLEDNQEILIQNQMKILEALQEDAVYHFHEIAK